MLFLCFPVHVFCMYSFCFCVYVCIYYNVVCMFLCGGTPCTGFAFCATPSLCDKLDNNNNNNNNNVAHCMADWLTVRS